MATYGTTSFGRQHFGLLTFRRRCIKGDSLANQPLTIAPSTKRRSAKWFSTKCQGTL